MKLLNRASNKHRSSVRNNGWSMVIHAQRSIRPWCGLLPAMFFLSACSSAVEDNWEEVQKSVIRLGVESYAGTSTGTAFSINDQGYYVTNFHVIEPAESGGDLIAYESVSPAFKIHPVEIIWSDPEKDLAIVKVESWINTPLSLIDDSSEIHVNLDVLSIGFPGSSDVIFQTENGEIPNAAYTIPTTKQGIISKAVNTPEVDLFEHSAVVNSGNSGGPLVDECGRVVGINVSKALSSFDIAEALDMAEIGYSQAQINIQEGTFFAINVSELTQVLTGEGIQYSATGKSCLGEQVKPNQLLAAMLGMLALIAAGLIALALYVKRKMPNEKLSVKAVTRVITKPFKGEDKTEAEDFPKPAVYRGDGGEIVHTDSVTIECVTGNGPSIRLLPGESKKIGRDPKQSDVVTLNERVSRQHVRVQLDKDGIVNVVDLKSAAGTFIDAERVPTEAPGSKLYAGQKLIVGSEEVVYMLA